MSLPNWSDVFVREREKKSAFQNFKKVTQMRQGSSSPSSASLSTQFASKKKREVTDCPNFQFLIVTGCREVLSLHVKTRLGRFGNVEKSRQQQNARIKCLWTCSKLYFSQRQNELNWLTVSVDLCTSLVAPKLLIKSNSLKVTFYPHSCSTSLNESPTLKAFKILAFTFLSWHNSFMALCQVSFCCKSWAVDEPHW